MTPIPLQLLDDALQLVQQDPPRDYQIDSRSSTPSVYPEYGPEDFEHWKDTLETVSRSLKALETSAEECRARILNDQYWHEESDHWKALYKEQIQRDGELAWERHSYDIDLRFWDAMSTSNWQEIYRALETQSRGPRLVNQFDFDHRDRRTITADIIYYKIAAEYWRAKYQSSNPSAASHAHRTTIRSYKYWQAEFDYLSEELRKLRAEGTAQRTFPQRNSHSTVSNDVVTSPPRRRSKRIESRRKEEASTKLAKPQGICRRRKGKRR